MKYLKFFENREIKYQYLNKQDTLILKDFIDDYIDKLELDKSIRKLKLDDYGTDFDYNEVWDELVIRGSYNDINGGNLYKLVDNIFRTKDCSTPAIRNSMSKILDFKYKSLGIEDKLNKRLIKIFEKNPDVYRKDYVDDFYINDTVKDACQWILDSKKYNL